MPKLICFGTATFYRFEAYNRNDADNYHPKVGIDPTGWSLPVLPGSDPLMNCPPDGVSKCPKPTLNSPSDFPSTMVWSPEFDHPGMTWASQSVAAEAVSTTISVWTYVAPDEAGIPSRSTYWDYASLVQVPAPSGRIISYGTFPAPDGAIQNVVSTTTAMRANLTWQTTLPAVTQVLYHYAGDATSTMLLPVPDASAGYEFSTTVDYASSTSHSVRLPNLRPQSAYDYAILSRRVVSQTCQTSVLTGRLLTSDALVPAGPLPTPGSDILGLTVLPFETSAYVIWQSAQPSYGQVLYHYTSPVTSTIYPTMTHQIYLPLIWATTLANGSASDYEFRTPIDAPTTLHIVHLAGLQRDSLYAAVAISAWNENDEDKAAASYRQAFRTATTPTLVSSDQLLEKLQACVARGNALNSCAEELNR